MCALRTHINGIQESYSSTDSIFWYLESRDILGFKSLILYCEYIYIYIYIYIKKLHLHLGKSISIAKIKLKKKNVNSNRPMEPKPN